MADEGVVRIISEPGIKRDGTSLEGDAYTGGLWCRFQRGLPRKIWGARSVNKYLRGLVREINAYTSDGDTYVHAGSSAMLERFYIDSTGSTSVISNRTPSTLTASANNMWQMDVGGAGTSVLLAQCAPNLAQISNNTGGQLFYGNLLATTVLTELIVTAGQLPVGVSLTGGIVSLYPYNVIYGSAGYVAWSVSGSTTNYTSSGSGSANVTAQKFVAALPLRGGPGNSPSALFWSLDSLVRMTFVGGTTVFQFDTISAESSILSQNSVIEYDGVYYWAGVDRFLMFNGVVREVPNNMNLNFFFDNMNWDYRQKCFVTKVPRFGEIWWCFPKGSSTEPNWAVIYNVRENTWYDTELPQSGRSAGTFASVFRKPLMAGVDALDYTASVAVVAAGGSGYVVGNVLTASGGTGGIPVEVTVATLSGSAVATVAITNAGQYTAVPANPVTFTGGSGTGATLTLTFVQPYNFWIHETGLDMIDGIDQQPIESYFETSEIALPVSQQKNSALHISMMEPDFVQSGDMTVQVLGRANARSPEVADEVKTLVETPSIPQEQVLYFKTQRREIRFRFGSNVLGGDYQMGVVLAHMRPGDGTVIG